MSEAAMRTQKEENNTNPTIQRKNHPVQQVNNTGIPTRLKERLEQSTGMPLDDVRVHYNSYLPERLDALAYTCGNQVEIGPGQENCLPHELGHVVQQKLGLVRANAIHSTGVAMNTETRLESQADEIGAGKKINIPAVSTGENIVQRRLFIRSSQEIIKKTDVEMMDIDSTELKKNIKNAGSGQRNRTRGTQKTAQYVGNDPGYVEITIDMKDKLLAGFDAWMKASNLLINPKIYDDKITKMITNTMNSAAPRTVYDNHLGGTRSVPRLTPDKEKEVSYYFESLDQFYLYLVLSKENRPGPSNDTKIPPAPSHWLKINVVNTGAGDAIVMTLPLGYLIVDLGTNLTILLNYLGLRRNKHVHSGNEKVRGIRLLGGETCIVITHGHTDHKGNDRKQFKYDEYDRKKLLPYIIVGCEEYYKAKNPNDPKHLQQDRVEKFLQSGDFNIECFEGSTSKDKNEESLVISRRVGDSEAVILSGDQMPDKLNLVVDNLLSEGKSDDSAQPTAVKNLWYKVAHHGSKKNNTPDLINKLNELGTNTDFVISSGKSYNHPDTKMFTIENKLHRQGTSIEFNRILFDLNADANAAQDTRTGRVFYTANLNERSKDITLSSIVYKSNGNDQVTYSKCYTDKSNSIKPHNVKKDNEILDSMLNQIGIDLNGEMAQVPSLECIQSLEQQIMESEDIGALINSNMVTLGYFFHGLPEDKQVKCLLCMSSDLYALNSFLDDLDMEKMKLGIHKAWDGFFESTRNWTFSWGRNYFYIMVKTCSQDKLEKSFIEILKQNQQYLWVIFLETVMICGRTPIKFIKLFINYVSNSDDPDSTPDYGILLNYISPDSTIINELLYNRAVWGDDGTEEKGWMQKRLAILQNLDLDQRNNFYTHFLDCESLKDEEMEELLNAMLEEDDIFVILWPFDISFFLELLHIYPQCSQTIYNVCDLIDLIMEIEEALEEDSEVSEVSEEQRMRENWYYMDEKMDGEWQSVDALKKQLNKMEMSFSTFINMITPEKFEEDFDGNMVYFNYASEQFAEHPEYLGELFNISYIYNKKEYVVAFMEEFLDTEDGLTNLVSFLSSGYLQPSVVDMCFDIVKSDEKILETLLEDPFVLIDKGFRLLVDMMLCPPVTLPDFVFEWTEDLNAKTKFYYLLAQISPELMAVIFTLHFESAQDHEKEQMDLSKDQHSWKYELFVILSNMGEPARTILFSNMDPEDASNLRVFLNIPSETQNNLL